MLGFVVCVVGVIFGEIDGFLKFGECWECFVVWVVFEFDFF